VIFGKEKGPEVIGVVARDVVFFQGGFESASLSGESGAKLIFESVSRRRPRMESLTGLIRSGDGCEGCDRRR